MTDVRRTAFTALVTAAADGQRDRDHHDDYQER